VYVYVDTSAMFKLLIAEPGSDQARRVSDAADGLVSSTLLYVESAAALSKAVRQGRLEADTAAQVFATFIILSRQMDLIAPASVVLNQAVDIALRTSLRGYDATHLASALVAGADLVLAADGDLLDAAQLYGLDIADCSGRS
jgi:uncharacterized protein